MPNFSILKSPATGTAIARKGGRLVVPDNPIVPYIEGDGTGPDIWRASVRVFDAAVTQAFGGKKKIAWFEVPAGEKAKDQHGEWLPNDTLEAVRTYKVAIKGPLTTPVGGGIRSLNVTLRQVLDLYSCVRPVRYFDGMPSPVKRPELMDVVIFRENTEDVYAGIEWARGSAPGPLLLGHALAGQAPRAHERRDFPRKHGRRVRRHRVGARHAAGRARHRVPRERDGEAHPPGFRYRDQADVGIRIEAPDADGRAVCGRQQLAKAEFRDKIVTEDEVTAGASREGKILVNDRIADSVFQQILTRTADYDVFATPNLNGDYLSDAAAAQVGGLGMAPGANIGDDIGFFEATHGTAPKYAGKDVINPGSVILSGVMMFRYLGWGEAADLVETGLEKTIAQKKVTYDLARQMEGATELKTSQFADAVIGNM